MNNQMIELRNTIQSTEVEFNDVLKGDLSFKQEAFFACQLLQGNSFLAGVAQKKPQSLINAVKNVAAISLSLNPALKLCYLVPRKGVVCLDIGYMGLIQLALQSKSVRWVQAKLVYENDTFKQKSIDEKPLHECDPFCENRGNMKGGYVTIKTDDGDYLTHTMTINKIYAIRNRSEAYKKGHGPWKSDEDQMILKTVIRSAYKLWPKTDRMDKAIELVSQHDDIDFDIPIVASDSKIAEIKELISKVDDGEKRLFAYIKSTTKREIDSVEDIGTEEADNVIKVLTMLIERQDEK